MRSPRLVLLALLLLSGCAMQYRTPTGPVWGYTADSATLADMHLISYAETPALCEAVVAQDCRPLSVYQAVGGGMTQQYYVFSIRPWDVVIGATVPKDCTVLRDSIRARGYSASACTPIGVLFLERSEK